MGRPHRATLTPVRIGGEGSDGNDANGGGHEDLLKKTD